MNWEAVGAVAEFLSSVGVLATLIYIAVQVREAKSINLINTSAEMTNNVSGRIIENPQLLEVVSKVNEKTGHQLSAVKEAIEHWDLTPQEAELWARYWGTVWRGFQARHSAGSLEDRTLSTFLSIPQARTYVRAVKYSFTDEFLQRLEMAHPGLFDGDT